MFSGFIKRLKKPKSNHGMTDDEWDRKVAREQYKAREEDREIARKEREARERKEKELKQKEAARQRKVFIEDAKKATKTTAKRGGKALGVFAKDMVHAGKVAAKGMGEWADRVGTDIPSDKPKRKATKRRRKATKPKSVTRYTTTRKPARKVTRKHKKVTVKRPKYEWI